MQRRLVRSSGGSDTQPALRMTYPAGVARRNVKRTSGAVGDKSSRESLTALPSHTTGHTDRDHGGFRQRSTRRWRARLTSPSASNQRTGMARLACSLSASRHQPFPDEASRHALSLTTPFFVRKSTIVLARLHRLSRTQRSLRRSQPSRSRSALWHVAWR